MKDRCCSFTSSSKKIRNQCDGEKRTRVKQMLAEIEKNIEVRKETDRAMWFSMWFLLSVASFGIAWFPMIYFLIKRRNAHFSRQETLENLVLTRLGKKPKGEPHYPNSSHVSEEVDNPTFRRNAQAWALSTLLVFPTFYVLYFLEKDLQKHEAHERSFWIETVSLAPNLELGANSHEFSTTRKFALDRYLVFNIVTCGFAAVYWLYRIFNDYNRHFRRQWKLEDELLQFFTETSNSEAN